MTWRTARAQLVSMIEGVAQSSIWDSSLGRFTHEPRFFESPFSGKPRRFGLRGIGVSTIAMATGAQSRRMRTDAELVLDYPMHGDGAKLDDVIWSDYETLRERLLDVSTWNRPTSTIEGLTLSEIDLDGATDDVDNADGQRVGRRLTILFTVSHTAQTS